MGSTDLENVVAWPRLFVQLIGNDEAAKNASHQIDQKSAGIAQGQAGTRPLKQKSLLILRRERVLALQFIHP